MRIKVIGYARRYAALAKEMAKTEKEASRKEELLMIAKNCERVSEYGAEGFAGFSLFQNLIVGGIENLLLERTEKPKETSEDYKER